MATKKKSEQEKTAEAQPADGGEGEAKPAESEGKAAEVVERSVYDKALERVRDLQHENEALQKRATKAETRAADLVAELADANRRLAELDAAAAKAKPKRAPLPLEKVRAAKAIRVRLANPRQLPMRRAGLRCTREWRTVFTSELDDAQLRSLLAEEQIEVVPAD